MTTKNKSNIVYKTDYSNCEPINFDESNRSLKLPSEEHKISARNCDSEKNEIAKHSWNKDHNITLEEKKVADKESRSIPRKINEILDSLKNPNYINLHSS